MVLIHNRHGIYPATKLVREDPWLVDYMQPFLAETGDWITCLLPGFRCDHFSVPRPAWWFQPPNSGPGTAGAGIHDAWYACQWPDSSKASRKLADQWAFLEILRDYGVAEWRAQTMYKAVRIGSGPAWRRKTDEGIEHNRRFVKFVLRGDEERLETIMHRGRAMAELMHELWKSWEQGKIDLLRRELKAVAAGHVDNALINV